MNLIEKENEDEKNMWSVEKILSHFVGVTAHVLQFECRKPCQRQIGFVQVVLFGPSFELYFFFSTPHP